MAYNTIKPIKSEELKAKLKALPENVSENDKIRIHRAISWLKSAEEHSNNPDIQFISLWISFNSCYASSDENDISFSEAKNFRDFVRKLIEHDEDNIIFELLWNKFSGAIRLLIDNKYAFKLFWDANFDNTVEWQSEFEKSNDQAMRYLSGARVDKLLSIVLDRLYTVRNQLIHGGATYMSKVNRAQVKDAGQILGYLLPVIINIMLENMEEDWGRIKYPVIK